jgi:hypothetical protein
LAAPLTQLLHKEGFLWTKAATVAFAVLKEARSTTPVLHLEDFTKPFTDFGAFLHQGAGPLAFYSKPFTARHMNVAAYERELIRLVRAVRHWRPYLWDHHFVVRTDHYTLKYMLDQCLYRSLASMDEQIVWL